VTKNRARRYSLKFFRVIWEGDQDVNEAVLDLKINRQVSPAVERNRIKRIVREFFRAHADVFLPGRWVFIAKPFVAKIPNAEIFSDLERILAWLRKDDV